MIVRPQIFNANHLIFTGYGIPTHHGPMSLLKRCKTSASNCLLREVWCLDDFRPHATHHPLTACLHQSSNERMCPFASNRNRMKVIHLVPHTGCRRSQLHGGAPGGRPHRGSAASTFFHILLFQGIRSSKSCAGWVHVEIQGLITPASSNTIIRRHLLRLYCNSVIKVVDQHLFLNIIDPSMQFHG